MKTTPRQHDALKKIAEGAFYPVLEREEDGYYARWKSLDGNPWIDRFVREALVLPSTRHAEREDHLTLHDAFISALKSETGRVIWNEKECADFAGELSAWREPLTVGRVGLTVDPGKLEISAEIPADRAGLKSLGVAAAVFPPLSAMRKRGGRLVCRPTMEEMRVFYRTGRHRLADVGFDLLGDDLAAEIEAEAEVDYNDAKGEGKVSLTVRVAGEKVSAAEIEWMLAQDDNLIFFRDHWIEVDRNILRQALRALNEVSGVRLDRMRAISFAAGLGSIGRMEMKAVAAKGWLRGLVENLRRHGGVKLPLSLKGFCGELREYQKRGAKWLDFMTSHGFGALLADEMGLGKTIQTIAWICGGRRKFGAPVLVAAPITLLWNWKKELEKFAPSLKVYVHHGSGRGRDEGFRRMAKGADVVLAGYSLLVRDYRDFASVEWGAMVLDEAQTIKNPDTKIAHAVCALRPARRVALTGTPVENSVQDIWSIEHFLNPGFLGERRDFETRFAAPLKENPLAPCGERLKRALDPFVLRRLKADPDIAAEIGDKREKKEYCELLPEARVAYERALADFKASPRKRGDIFALITDLKLICDGEGKLQRLEELLDSIFAAGESALVFTQYVKIAALIARRLEKRYGRRFPFLHGALPLKAREREIAAFNNSKNPEAFLLSLKAGGFGLNLVKATHVIHFDRWWNPAVENQATDRAHRIGQSRDVLVHSLITVGTIEEHVDDILSRKRDLAGILSFAGEEFFKLVGLSS